MKPHPSIKKLREAAVKEVKSVAVTNPQGSDIKFDSDHSATPRAPMRRSAEELDTDNWVAKYPGQNSPHVGNGSGGIR